MKERYTVSAIAEYCLSCNWIIDCFIETEIDLKWILNFFARLNHTAISQHNMNANTASSSSEIQWCFSQVKGTLDDDVTEGKNYSAILTSNGKPDCMNPMCWSFRISKPAILFF